MSLQFDVIIIGGGHAGVEAALAVGRMGSTAAIITMDKNKLALMSCNPAIGGIAKSHVVKEVDALGGLMGQAIDATGIQYRRLNLSRGPAVWSTRIQADRILYNKYIVDFVAAQKNVTVIEALADEIKTSNDSITGVMTDKGEFFKSKAVVVATGTFLGGLIHIGDKKIVAGRYGEDSAMRLSESFRSLGFEIGRLKTGTPPRLDGSTIDWSKCEIQLGDEAMPRFSYRSSKRDIEQVPCYLTKTTTKTRDLVMASSHLSPIFSGQIDSAGPRYCPSIEDKYYRFADKESHQIFLEPEGNGTNEIYPNGFSTSLPESVQREAIKTIVGLEKVEITRPGYAVEYDYCPPNQIKPNLETYRVKGLFLAGQINGTSGYEEAAGQGLMAGVNAFLSINNEKPFILDRSEAYIGVMIDDLTTRSSTEPYRLFTSRAEYRLAIREDNSRDRLFEHANKLGLIGSDDFEKFAQLKAITDKIITILSKSRIKTEQLGELAERFVKVDNISLENLIKQPNISIDKVISLIRQFEPSLPDHTEAMERAAIQIRYSGYIEKQQREIDKFKKMEKESIPLGFNYSSINGLKKEAIEKFLHFQPVSLGQAGRIEGVTPGDISVLSVFLKRHKAAAS